jgi:hypothetical protein
MFAIIFNLPIRGRDCSTWRADRDRLRLAGPHGLQRPVQPARVAIRGLPSILADLYAHDPMLSRALASGLATEAMAKVAAPMRARR